MKLSCPQPRTGCSLNPCQLISQTVNREMVVCSVSEMEANLARVLLSFMNLESLNATNSPTKIMSAAMAETAVFLTFAFFQFPTAKIVAEMNTPPISPSIAPLVSVL